MLAADKLQLQSTLKQQATALKEKEFNLHHGNFMTVGTQAAVLAGLDVTMFIEFQPPPNDEWVCCVLHFCFVCVVMQRWTWTIFGLMLCQGSGYKQSQKMANHSLALT